MFDFERAKLLMEIIVEAGKHGPIYQKIAGLAQEELKSMMDWDKPQEGRVVTPPEGPANSAIEHEDGSMEQIVQEPAPVEEPVIERPNPAYKPQSPHLERKI